MSTVYGVKDKYGFIEKTLYIDEKKAQIDYPDDEIFNVPVIHETKLSSLDNLTYFYNNYGVCCATDNNYKSKNIMYEKFNVYKNDENYLMTLNHEKIKSYDDIINEITDNIKLLKDLFPHTVNCNLNEELNKNEIFKLNLIINKNDKINNKANINKHINFIKNNLEKLSKIINIIYKFKNMKHDIVTTDMNDIFMVDDDNKEYYQLYDNNIYNYTNLLCYLPSCGDKSIITIINKYKQLIEPIHPYYKVLILNDKQRESLLLKTNIINKLNTLIDTLLKLYIQKQKMLENKKIKLLKQRVVL